MIGDSAGQASVIGQPTALARGAASLVVAADRPPPTSADTGSVDDHVRDHLVRVARDAAGAWVGRQRGGPQPEGLSVSRVVVRGDDEDGYVRHAEQTIWPLYHDLCRPASSTASGGRPTGGSMRRSPTVWRGPRRSARRCGSMTITCNCCRHCCASDDRTSDSGSRSIRRSRHRICSCRCRCGATYSTACSAPTSLVSRPHLRPRTSCGSARPCRVSLSDRTDRGRCQTWESIQPQWTVLPLGESQPPRRPIGGPHRFARISAAPAALS